MTSAPPRQDMSSTMGLETQPRRQLRSDTAKANALSHRPVQATAARPCSLVPPKWGSFEPPKLIVKLRIPPAKLKLLLGSPGPRGAAAANKGCKNTKIRPSRKRKAESEASGAAKKSCNNQQASSSSGQLSPLLLHDHLVLSDDNDIDLFTAELKSNNTVLSHLRVLEVHLDASKHDEFADFRLALALKALHPRPDGTNPHQLQQVKLVMEGRVVYTRYAYHLASPAMSDDASRQLRQLATGGLTRKEKAALAYLVTTTEKAVAQALLGIRGVEQVIVTGTGRMEKGFSGLLEEILVHHPGDEVIIPPTQMVFDSDAPPCRKGRVFSAAYRARMIKRTTATATATRNSRPYATRNRATSEHDFSSFEEKNENKDRYLVDERVQLLEHLLGRSEVEGTVAAIEAALEIRQPRVLRKVTVDDDTGSQAKRQATNSPASRQEGELDMAKMVRINPVPPVGKGWLLPTSDEGTVYLGWKFR